MIDSTQPSKRIDEFREALGLFKATRKDKSEPLIVFDGGGASSKIIEGAAICDLKQVDPFPETVVFLQIQRHLVRYCHDLLCKDMD